MGRVRSTACRMKTPAQGQGAFVGAVQATIEQADAALVEQLQFSFRLKRLRHTDVQQWRLALDALESLDWMPGGPPPGRIVPQTALRKFYWRLRAMSRADQEAMAQKLDTPQLLRQLVKESVQQFAAYENTYDSFSPVRSWWGINVAAAFCARELQALLDPAKIQPGQITWSVNGPTLPFSTVDFEVSSLRTKNQAVLNDGTRVANSGLGGMDLLLCCDDGVPVVAEIKGPGDTNLFLALIQAVTYAVELTTQNQFRRLKKSYPKHFRDLQSERPMSDVSIIYLGTDEPPLKVAAMRIAREYLRGDQSTVECPVRRIAFVRVEFNEGKLRFSCEALATSR